MNGGAGDRRAVFNVHKKDPIHGTPIKNSALSPIPQGKNKKMKLWMTGLFHFA